MDIKFKPLETANCCHCGRIIDTREKSEGGDDFGAQLTDKRWTCSLACWDAVVDPSTLVEHDETAERETAVARLASENGGAEE